MSGSLAQDTGFRQTWFRTGYAADEVEDFVEAVVDALRSPTPRLDAFDVARQRFTPVILKPGYQMSDVDRYLDEVEVLLSQRAEGGLLSSPGGGRDVGELERLLSGGERVEDAELASSSGGRHRRGV